MGYLKTWTRELCHQFSVALLFCILYWNKQALTRRHLFFLWPIFYALVQCNNSGSKPVHWNIRLIFFSCCLKMCIRSFGVTDRTDITVGIGINGTSLSLHTFNQIGSGFGNWIQTHRPFCSSPSDCPSLSIVLGGVALASCSQTKHGASILRKGVGSLSGYKTNLRPGISPVCTNI